VQRRLATLHSTDSTQVNVFRSDTQSVRYGNDPSAGSPTETLLRLLLPLNVQVWASFQTQRCHYENDCAGRSEDLTKTFNR
jgi:hypothetical protein